MIESILLELAKLTPVIALLIAAVWYFLKREEKNELEIEELHLELRSTEKENLTALYKLMGVIEKIEGKEKGRNDILIKEIQEMRKSLEDKINALNK